MTDKTSMTYWFPMLESAGLPVPKTKMVSMPPELCMSICMVLYGEKPEIDPRGSLFLKELTAAVEEIGTPCFLRTCQTSAKHSWDKSCFISDTDNLLKHVYLIAEFSEMAGIIGLRYDTWFVRELLPSIKFGVCPNYDNMPVAREFRFFVQDGQIRCFHPYWPLEALRDGGWEGTEEQYESLCGLGKYEDEVRALAKKVGEAIPGAWSVDLLHTERGWFVTDMAEAHKSYHWEGCAYDL